MSGGPGRRFALHGVVEALKAKISRRAPSLPGDRTSDFPEDSLELIREVRRLELRTRGLVESVYGGEYDSIFHGAGSDFSHVREYQFGDDVRSIDWKVTARRGVPFVRQFVAERDLVVVLLIDVSASSRFSTGRRSVAEVTAEIAAALALTAVRNNDRVALMLMSESVESFLPPGSGRKHALRLLAQLLSHHPASRGTNLTVGLEGILRGVAERAGVFVISDFIPGDANPLDRGTLVRLTQRHHLVAVRLTAPEEGALPSAGWVHWTDPETGRRVLLDTGSLEVRERFRKEVVRARSEFAAEIGAVGADLVEVDTSTDPVEALSAFFRRARSRAS